ncbi:hypothetical protein BKA63DRAFT_401267, partial [Paraphoma chrysanthemicola]
QKPFPFLHLPRELQLQILAATPLVQATHVRIVDGKFSRDGLTHTFADLANDIFFSRNVFSIHTWRTNVVWEDKGNLEGMYSFLAGLLPQALARIRRLEILLPPVGDTSHFDGKLDWMSSWQASMQLLATHATLSSLVLTIKIGNKDQHFTRKEHFTTQEEIQILQAFQEVVRPLVRWEELKRLYVYVPYPFGSDNEGERIEVERRLEQTVMGPNYDAYCMGKPEPDAYTRPFLRDWWE